MKRTGSRRRVALQAAIDAVLDAPDETGRASAARAVESELGKAVAEPDSYEAPDVAGLLADNGPLLRDVGATLRSLDDAALLALNRLLPWGAMTVDEAGRLLGHAWTAQKRQVPHPPIDPRQAAFDKVYPLAGKHAFEAGCFEGIHTLGLLLLGARVTGADGRIENVVKTLTRLWAYGRSADLLLWDFERPAPAHAPSSWDMLHHVGVLYHLTDPVAHLDELLPCTGEALLLDTHVALDDADAREAYEVGGRRFRYRHYLEPAAASAPFAGLLDHGKWLLLEDLVDLIRSHGFGETRVVEDWRAPHGRRVMIWGLR